MGNNILKYINKIFLVVLIIVSIVFITFLVYKYIIPSINNCLLPISIGLFVFAWFSYFLLNYNSKKNTKIESNKKVFLLSDNPITLDKEAISPILKIINAHSFTSSFSMALIGKWGSGKSSYLKTLETELKGEEKYEVISINVWQLENSENITHELKKELDNIIFKYDKVVWLTQVIKRIFIQDYFAIISKYLTKSPLKVSFTFEPTLKDSKENLKTVLNEVLNGRKIILLIDELDRIDEPSDILNIFKVIHYVDDFEDIFTITAMDIEQIENKIEDINYIHKIFNLKYSLPTRDKDKVIQYYRNEIFEKSSKYIKKEKFETILTTPSVIAVISNYRIIKNSFNDTIIFISSLQEENPNDWNSYISFKFIFLVNLIKAVDFEFYSYMVLNQQLLKLIKFSELKDTETKTKIGYKKDFFIEEPLLEKLSKKLYFNKLLSLVIQLKNDRNINQYFDIYQSYTIENYHITEKRYNEFISDKNTFKEYFNELNFSLDKSKFLLNLLTKISSNTKHQKILLPNLIDSLLSMDTLILRDNSFSKRSVSYWRGNKDIVFPSIYILATKAFVRKENTQILLQLVQSKKELSTKFISYLLEDFSKQENIDGYDTQLIGDLLKSSLENLEKSNIYEISNYINFLSKENINKNSFLYKIIYEYCLKLEDSIEISSAILEYFQIETIPKFLNKLNVTIDNFIHDEYKYHIWIGNSTSHLSGKELKEKLKNLKN